MLAQIDSILKRARFFHSKDEWLRFRSLGITGTDFPKINGDSKYGNNLDVLRSKVVGDSNPVKIDSVEDINADTTEQELKEALPRLLGHTLEDFLIRIYKQRMPNRKIHTYDQFDEDAMEWVFTHPDFDFIIGSYDGIIEEDDGTIGLLEIKTSLGFAQKDWVNGVPIYYRGQGEHYLLSCPEAQYIDFIVLLGNNKVDIFRIYADPNRMAEVFKIESEFWDVVSSYEEDRSKLLPVNPTHSMVQETQDDFEFADIDDEWNRTLQEYRESKDSENFYKSKQEKLKEEIINHFGAKHLFFNGNNVAKISISSYEKFDSVKFKKENQDIYDKYKTIVTTKRIS